MEYRGTITVRRPRAISNAEYTRVLEALERRHEELGPVGGGGTRDTAVYVLSTDRYDLAALAAEELLEAVVDALRYAGLADAWPVDLNLEVVEVGDDEEEPRAAHG
jgi:hypothetical protein